MPGASRKFVPMYVLSWQREVVPNNRARFIDETVHSEWAPTAEQPFPRMVSAAS